MVSIACVVLTFVTVVARNHVKVWLVHTLWHRDPGSRADLALFRQSLEPENAAPPRPTVLLLR